MRFLFILVGFSAILIPLSQVGRAQTADAPPASPSDFDSSAKAPPNLPDKLDIPANTHIDVKGWRKKKLPPLPPNANDPRLLWAPDLESATIERNEQDVHAVFQWEGGRTSDAFIIHGLCFRLLSLAYPNTVGITGSALDFWVNRTDPNGGQNGNFPVISAYSPTNFAGKASLNGNDVLVFAPGGKKSPVDKSPVATTYPEGPSLCLDAKTLLPVWIDTGDVIYTFAYTPDSNVQINPQGPYLKAIQKQFGHWP